MSKTSLKKAIKEFTPDQLRGLILDIYSKYKDAKEYLDFFAEPDLDKVHEKYSLEINKEVNRIYHRSPAPRIQRIKASIKKFAMLEPGYESVAQLMVETVEQLIINGKGDKYSPGAMRGTASLLEQTCEFLERNDCLDSYLPRLSKAVESVKRKFSFYNEFYNLLKPIITSRIEEDEK